MKRSIERTEPARVEYFCPLPHDLDVRVWLTEQADAHQLPWLLAHALDGVIWGYMEGKNLILSGDVTKGVSPSLRTETLQSARLFAPHAELALWRTDDGWEARLIENDAGPSRATLREYIDEAHLLWGTHGAPVSGTQFVVMRDGEEELRHVVPYPVAKEIRDDSRPLRLGVRQYIEYDDRGLGRISLGRLRCLYMDEGGKT